MYRERRKNLTLMPAVSLAALCALVTVPTLSSVRLYAAPPERVRVVIVKPGDSLWSIADRFSTGDVQDTLDAIVAANGLHASTIVPGQHLKIPQ